MKKEELVAKGLSEEHAQIAVDAWNESVKDFVPKERFDEINGKLKEANTTIETLKKDNSDNEELQKGQGVQGEGDNLGGRFGQHGKRIRPEG